MGNLWNEIKQSLQMFLKSPGFSIAAVAALALGIGANSAIFSVVNAVLLKPLSYPDADRMVQFLAPSSEIASNLSCIPEFHFYRQQTSVFEEVAAYDLAGPGFNLSGDHPEQLHGIHVTEGYFRLYGAPVMLGRTFTPEEDSPHGGKVVVLSYGLWQRKLAGNPGIVGKPLWLGNEPYTIVGVIGNEFVADPQADIWLPFQFEPVSQNMNHFFQVVGMLKPGITVAEANARLMAAAPQYHRDYPKTNPRRRFAVGPLRDSIVAGARERLLMMLATVGLVLLIACANVANLLLARAAGRKHEFAVRSALGAGRGRIVRQLLTESLLLSLTGGLCGLVSGIVGVRALLAVSPASLPRVGEHGAAIGLDWRVLGFTLGVSLLTGILFGLYPAFAGSRIDLNSAFKESGNRSGTGFRQGKARSLLIASEISLALVVVTGSALLIRSFIALRAVDPGFDSHHVLTMEMSLNGQRYQKTAGVVQLLRDGRERLNAIPGVELAAAVYWLPIDVEDAMPFHILRRPITKDCCGSKWMSITPGYLKLFRIPLLRGRDFTENDRAGTPGVALINEALANRLWPHQDPVGQQILCGQGIGPEMEGEPVRQIIGIVADSHNSGLAQPAHPMMMVPIAQVPDGYAAAYSNIQPMFWLVRTHSDPHQAVAAAAEQLRVASQGFPVAHVRTMDEVMGRSTARERFNMVLLIIFGAVALALAAIGIYGLMAYSVAQRTREMGIRMALGADRSRVVRLVLGDGLKLGGFGLAFGLAGALVGTRLLTSQLYGAPAVQPLVFASALGACAVALLIASWLPAWRATGVDPVEALRSE